MDGRFDHGTKEFYGPKITLLSYYRFVNLTVPTGISPTGTFSLLERDGGGGRGGEGGGGRTLTSISAGARERKRNEKKERVKSIMTVMDGCMFLNKCPTRMYMAKSETDRQTYRQRQIETETDRQRKRVIQRQRDRKRERLID